jgi:hypothetical protein
VSKSLCLLVYIYIPDNHSAIYTDKSKKEYVFAEDIDSCLFFTGRDFGEAVTLII